MADDGRPVLVTGSNRSGTTWVGEMLCGSHQLEYLHEPFNSSIWPRLLDVPLRRHYTYVGPENEAPFVGPMGDLLRYRFALVPHLRQVGTDPRRLAKVGREEVRSLRRRLHHRRPLLKDPIALFASEWMADRFGAQVVVMVRHPAAFASSIKRLGWTFDVGYLLDQPALMQRYLEPFRADLERCVAERPPPFEQSILLWRLFYATVRTFRDQRTDFHIVSYETLADEPADGFARLYKVLDLDFTDDARRLVGAWSAQGNVTEVAAHDPGTTKRDSKASGTLVGHQRLTPHEVDLVKAGTADVWPSFYAEGDW